MITGTLFGQLVSKANSRQAVPTRTKSGRSFTRFIKSSKAFEFEESALYQLKSIMRGKEALKGSLRLDCIIYYPSRRSDNDPSLLMDILQKAGVYENDRQIDILHSEKRLDTLNPRVVFTVYETEEDNLQAL